MASAEHNSAEAMKLKSASSRIYQTKLKTAFCCSDARSCAKTTNDSYEASARSQQSYLSRTSCMSRPRSQQPHH
eukprot:3858-Heterococcus_DN1.PRE.2